MILLWGNLMFYLYLIIGMSSLTFIVNKLIDYRSRRSVFTLWDRNASYSNETNHFETFKYYFENMNLNLKNGYSVDDITWNDLNMTQIFEKGNYTFTSVGEEVLYYRLKTPHKDHSFNEEMIEKITQDRLYRDKLSLILSKLGKIIHANSSKYIFSKPDFKFHKAYILLSILPIIGMIILFFFPVIGLSLLIISSLINVAISYFIRTKNGDEYESLFYALNTVSTSRKLAKINNNKDLLKRTNKFKKASYVSGLLFQTDPSATDFLTQILVLIKSLFLADYFIFHYIKYFMIKNQDIYGLVWKELGDIDSCYSIALWRKSLPYYCLPSMNTDNSLNVKSAYHPLLKEAVGNNFNFNRNILLTGSNASGKSTFLKTIAVNIILSQALNTSTSKHISLNKGPVYSSMAMSDDIEKGESYFLSEINSLKRIVDIRAANKDTHMYLFIDEIFKGTNTIERIAAAESVLSYLNKYEKTSIMAATHDLELTDKLRLKYKNYHFSEKIMDDEIIFDYLIKEGFSKTRNAIELLRITGFPNEVYTRAVQNTTV